MLALALSDSIKWRSLYNLFAKFQVAQHLLLTKPPNKTQKVWSKTPSTSTFLEWRRYTKVYGKLRHRYTIIVLYHIRDLPYDSLYMASRSFEPFDIRYDTTLCECCVAGVYQKCIANHIMKQRLPLEVSFKVN